MTGAEFIAKDLGMKVDTTVVEQLGTARKVTIGANFTRLIADSASKDEIDMRIAQVGLGMRWWWLGVCHAGSMMQWLHVDAVVVVEWEHFVLLPSAMAKLNVFSCNAGKNVFPCVRCNDMFSFPSLHHV